MAIVNSPIHDLLVRIKNWYLADKGVVEGVVYSGFVENVLKLLKKHNFIKDYEVRKDGNKAFVDIVLWRVKDKVNDIPVIKFYSRPSRRWYVSYKDLRPVAGGRGIGIISTSKGVMDTYTAKKNKLWGELIAEIY